jgi:hypothetical protein
MLDDRANPLSADDFELVRLLQYDARGRRFVGRFNALFKRRTATGDPGRSRRRGPKVKQWKVPELREFFTVEGRNPTEKDEAKLRTEWRTLLTASCVPRPDALMPEEDYRNTPPVILALPWFVSAKSVMPVEGYAQRSSFELLALRDSLQLELGIKQGVLFKLPAQAKVIDITGLPLEDVRQFNDALISDFTRRTRCLAKLFKASPSVRRTVTRLKTRVVFDPTKPELRGILRGIIVKLRQLRRSGMRFVETACPVCKGHYPVWPGDEGICLPKGGCEKASR